jgi:site-specific recombinase XerD
MRQGEQAAAVLRPDEVTALLNRAGNAPAGLRLAALVATLYHACPRLGVALGVRMDDVDLTAAQIRLSGRRDWTVPLDEAPLARLTRWIACRASLGLDAGLLFCTFDGGRLDDSYVRRELGALGRRAGIGAAVGAEMLRRSGAARLVAEGVGDAHLQERLDHGRTGVTTRYRERLAVPAATPSREARRRVLASAVRERMRARRLVAEARPLTAANRRTRRLDGGPGSST